MASFFAAVNDAASKAVSKVNTRIDVAREGKKMLNDPAVRARVGAKKTASHAHSSDGAAFESLVRAKHELDAAVMSMQQCMIQGNNDPSFPSLVATYRQRAAALSQAIHLLEACPVDPPPMTAAERDAAVLVEVQDNLSTGYSRASSAVRGSDATSPPSSYPQLRDSPASLGAVPPQHVAQATPTSAAAIRAAAPVHAAAAAPGAYPAMPAPGKQVITGTPVDRPVVE